MFVCRVQIVFLFAEAANHTVALNQIESYRADSTSLVMWIPSPHIRLLILEHASIQNRLDVGYTTDDIPSRSYTVDIC
jgi:hypothetical protein